ncbi:MAG TPA: thiamine biosynthesis protein ThiF [Streptosporangiaceae bacterium]|nr:thiamine biosynthesis protein ThiF [Streptosporangiaceae bacterium]
MRPAIKPGLQVVWRDRDTLQIGIDPRRAVALTGMRRRAALIGLLDGSREHGQVLAAAEELGIPAAAADRVIGLLAAAGALQDFPAAELRALPDGPRARLAGELATVSLAHGHADGGARVLARRQAATVRVYGAGPVGSEIAGLLAASGVGRVACTGPVGQPAARAGVPGRPPWARRRAGTSRSRTPRGAAAASGPPAGTAPPPGAARRSRSGPAQPPDLAVLADGYPPELPARLVAGGVVHLAASAREAIGVVGPLVLPGESACLGCVELARADRDPAWPFILAQLAGPAAHPAACAVTLATAVAAQAVSQVLGCLDLARPPDAVLNGTLELVSPAWQWRRRSWPRHGQCPCSNRLPTCRRI